MRKKLIPQVVNVQCSQKVKYNQTHKETRYHERGLAETKDNRNGAVKNIRY